jgi:hypothetical protein
MESGYLMRDARDKSMKGMELAAVEEIVGDYALIHIGMAGAPPVLREVIEEFAHLTRRFSMARLLVAAFMPYSFFGMRESPQVYDCPQRKAYDWRCICRCLSSFSSNSDRHRRGEQLYDAWDLNAFDRHSRLHGRTTHCVRTGYANRLGSTASHPFA